MYYLILISLSVVASVYYYITRTFNYWKSRNVAGPTPVPLFGNIKDSALRRKLIATILYEIYKEYPNDKVVGIYRMTTPCLLLKDLEVLKHILIRDFDVFESRGVEFSKEGYGANLFHADGDIWRVLRSYFTPIFSSGKLKNMLYLMTERADKFVEHVDSICRDHPEQLVHKLFQKYTMATISACAFGLDIDMLGDVVNSLYKLDEMALSLNHFNELDMMYPGILKKITNTIFPRIAKEIFDGIVKTVITQRNGVPSGRNDFMDLILALKQKGEIKGKNGEDYASFKLTESVIAAQAFVFFLGGYETSATTMAFMLHELALNPEIQEKVIAEVDEVLHKNNGELTYETLIELAYLNKTFNETLRKYPIVDPIQRCAKIDYKISGTNVTVKKGQTVLVSPRGIHYDEKYYPDPHKFDPERFSPEIAGARPSSAYMPFGIGPRSCIGMRFAKVQSLVCLFKLFSKFRVEPSDQTKSSVEYNPWRLVVSPIGGLPLNIIHR